MTRKKRLLVLVLVVATILVLVASLISNRAGQATACQELIYGMESGDVERTYAMLSEPAQNQTSLEEWEEQVDFVQRMYTGLEKPVELIEREENTSVASGQSITTETYRIVTDFGPWQASCVFYEPDGSFIGNFTTDIGV